MDIFPQKEKRKLLQSMNLNYAVEAEKADVLLLDISKNRRECFGVVHVKASIAERRQNDQNFSLALLSKNYFSPFMTMDCKSMPSANPVNKGEFGITIDDDQDNRIDKRKEFEEEGYFSSCFS